MQIVWLFEPRMSSACRCMSFWVFCVRVHPCVCRLIPEFAHSRVCLQTSADLSRFVLFITVVITQPWVVCNHLSVLLIFYVFLWGRGKGSWPIASSCYSFHNRAASRAQCVRVWQSYVVKGTLLLDFTPLRLTGLSLQVWDSFDLFYSSFLCLFAYPASSPWLKGCCELQDFECYIWGQLLCLKRCVAGSFCVLFDLF